MKGCDRKRGGALSQGPRWTLATLFLMACSENGERTPKGTVPESTGDYPSVIAEGSPSPQGQAEATPNETQPGADGDSDTDSQTTAIDLAQAEPETAPVRGSCEVDPEAARLGQSEARRVRSARLGFGSHGGLAAWEMSSTEVGVRPFNLNGEAVGEPQRFAHKGGNFIEGVVAFGDRFVLISSSVCASHHRWCLHLRTVTRDGIPLSEPFERITGEGAGVKVQTDARGLVMGRNHTYIAPVLERYMIAEDGSISHELIDEDLSHGAERNESEMPRLLEVATDGTRTVALVVEADSPRVWLHGLGETVRVRNMSRTSLVRSFGFYGEQLEALWDSSHGGLVHSVFALDGTAIGENIRVRRRDPIENDRIHAVYLGSKLQRYDRGGRKVGPTISLPRGRTGDVAGSNALFFAVTGSKQDGIRLHTVRCSE